MKPIPSFNRAVVGRLRVNELSTPSTAPPKREAPSESKALVDVETIARFLAISKSWVYEQAKRHGLPHFQVGRYLRFDQNEVERWLQTKRQG